MALLSSIEKKSSLASFAALFGSASIEEGLLAIVLGQYSTNVKEMLAKPTVSEQEATQNLKAPKLLYVARILLLRASNLAECDSLQYEESKKRAGISQASTWEWVETENETHKASSGKRTEVVSNK